MAGDSMDTFHLFAPLGRLPGLFIHLIPVHLSGRFEVYIYIV